MTDASPTDASPTDASPTDASPTDASPSDPSRPARRRRHLAWWAVLLIAGQTVVERLDIALSAMHRAGDISARFGTVASPASLWSPRSASEMLRAWRDWDADRLAAKLGAQVAGPHATLFGYALVNWLMVALPVALLLRLFGAWVRDRVVAEGTGPTQATLVRLTGLSRQATLVYLALAAGRDLAVPLVWWLWHSSEALRVTGLLCLAALLALGLVLLTLLMAVIGLVRGTPYQVSFSWLRTGDRWMVGLRTQFLAAAGTAALFLLLRGGIGLQIDDVVMRWIAEPSGVFYAALAALDAWALIMCTGRLGWDRYRRDRRPDVALARRTLVKLGVTGLLLALGGYIIGTRIFSLAFGEIFVGPGGLLLLFAILSWPLRGGQPAPARPKPEPTAAESERAPALVRATRSIGRNPDPPPDLLHLLAAVPFGALGLVALRAGVTLAVAEAVQALYLFLIATVAWVIVLAALDRRLRGRLNAVPPGPVLALLTPLTLAAAVALGVKPIELGQRVGTVAVLFLFVACVVLVLFALARIGDGWRARGALAFVGLNRVPVLTLVLICFAVTSVIDQTDHYHDVRLGNPLAATYHPLDSDDALTAWVKQNQPETAAGGSARVRVPMVFLATAGGGIRSAYWTAMVLNCLFAAQPVRPDCQGDPLPQRAVFAASGISGGSLGLAADRAMQGTGLTYASTLTHDFLAPDLAAFAFRDTPISWLRLEPRGIDRGAVTEQAWESAFGPSDPLARGFLSSSFRPDGTPIFPLLLLNSATIDDGCRLNGSVLQGAVTAQSGPPPPAGTQDCFSLTPFAAGREQPDSPNTLAGTKDLYDYLCRPDQTTHRDLALSTAALLSARFPYVSPTGGLTNCANAARRTFATDGGLVEISAVSPLAEIWARIAGRVRDIDADPTQHVCIEPRLLMLDNSYLEDAPAANPGQPHELLAPATGQLTASNSVTSRAQQAAALAFDNAFGDVACRDANGGTDPPETLTSRVAHLLPVARPGPQAPLGWSLSTYARRDLDAQLDSPENRCQLAVVRSWFQSTAPAGTPRCLTGFIVGPSAKPGAGARVSVTDRAQGQAGIPGVTLRVTGCPTCTVTTGAAGRFDLMFSADHPVTLTVRWDRGQATVPLSQPLTAPVTVLNFQLS